MGEELTSLLGLYRGGSITRKSFACKVRSSDALTAELSAAYPTASDLNEACYCVTEGLTSPPLCRCGKPLKWSGRMSVGYRGTCGSPECGSGLLSEKRKGNRKVSGSRDAEFSEWERGVAPGDMSDDVVRTRIRHAVRLRLVTNAAITDYLLGRFPDSSSVEESFRRVMLGVERKPLCPVCGKPVTFVGRKGKMFTKYCSNRCAGSSAETIGRKKATQLSNWGAEDCKASELYRARMKEVLGVECVTQLPEMKAKRERTLIERYGTTGVLNVAEFADKMRRTNMERYGYPCAFQRPDIRELAYKANAKTVGTSAAEERVHGYFLELGINPERHYSTEDFPYPVDFYIREWNLRVEYQGSQYHHYGAYLGTPSDIAEADRLRTLDAEGGGSTQYGNMLKVWTGTDVRKRELARDKGLPYLELFSCGSADELRFQLSMYRGCAEGNLMEYPMDALERELEHYRNLKAPTVDFRGRGYGKAIVKHYQGAVFYGREYRMYADDPVARRRLIQNRTAVLGKKECRLTVNDLIGGFKKSGMCYGYSHFNPSITNFFVNRYCVESVYDPCGGWGHHLLGMLSCGRIVYNELSSETYANVVRMRDELGLTNVECLNGDAVETVVEGVDAWFMCPPYYNVEVYGGRRYSSRSEYDGFLRALFRKWEMSGARVFGVVIRDDFSGVFGRDADDVYPIATGQLSHLTGGRKKRGESLYVWKREGER